jgi:hypothetical protein
MDDREHFLVRGWMRAHALFGDVAPRAGGSLIVSDSHRLVHKYFTDTAGDVILLHPLLLHVATSNNGDEPRFLLSGAIDLPSMWSPRAS